MEHKGRSQVNSGFKTLASGTKEQLGIGRVKFCGGE